LSQYPDHRLQTDGPNPVRFQTAVKKRTTLQALIAVAQPELQQSIAAALRLAGFELAFASHGTEVLRLIHETRPAVIILDRIIPGISGSSLAAMIRADPNHKNARVVILSESQEISDRIYALDSGADDYIVLPCDMDELLSRITSLKRSQPTGRLTQVLKAGPIEMVPEQWVVYVAGTPVDLTEKEYRLLQELLEAKGRVLTREVLLERVWGHQKFMNLETRTVDVHMSRLRNKLGASAANIITVRNVGYRIAANPEWLAP